MTDSTHKRNWFAFRLPLAFVVFTCFGESDIHAGEPIIYKADVMGILAVKVSPDGKLIAVGGVSGKVGLWDVAKRNELRTFQASEEPIWLLAFSPDGRLLLTADQIGVVRLWNIASHQKRAELHGHKGYVSGASFSPDGKILATASRDGTIRIWSMKDLKTRKLIRLRGKASVTDVAFSPVGRKTLAALQHGVGLKLWKDGFSAEPARIKTPVPLGGMASTLAFSPKGDRIAVTGMYFLQVFELPSGKLLHSAKIFGSHTEKQTTITEEGWDIAFSPDGKLLAIAVRRSFGSFLGPTWEGEVQIWDAQNFRQLRVLRGHTSSVFAVAFLPDGNTLVSGSMDGTARLWPMTSIPQRRAGCRRRIGARQTKCRIFRLRIRPLRCWRRQRHTHSGG